ncbi:hypothetical protein Rsub_07468 [Raphidocelis subcapitata]|uniref:Short-chain dehydrogenase n=1 Tax=Raphidocelis subcapitata TaxID=307507 RepID=A0A2V0PCS0_9CHLO|nr:hypothetical protein Rsub_07468 [Raphidocelis subcapitata]|eukprot:GBF94967.1 hypothetical protein Rsub_07468 [Raphidocelis subcapitata]
MATTDKKTVIVFGATGTVGRALVKMLKDGHLGMAGIKIVAVGVDGEECKKLEKEMGVHTMCKDACDMKACQEVFDMHKGEGILGVVDTIGEFSYKPMADMTADDVMAVIKNNVPASFNIMKLAGPLMAEQGGGSIVCVGAAVTHHGIKHHEAFAAAKGAVESLFRNAAALYAPKNVRINCVAPGLIKHPASAGISLDPEMEKASRELYPMKRLATPEDVAHAICFLLHPLTTFTTGHAFPVDGGLCEVQVHGIAHHAAATKA